MDFASINTAVSCGLLTANEIRCSNGLILTSMNEVSIEQRAPKSTDTATVTPTNCVNCGAVINPNVDHCEYCGTSYSLMGVPCAPKKLSKRELLVCDLLVENDRVEIQTLYEDVLNAMKSYGRGY